MPRFTMTTHTITFGSVCSGIEAASVAWHPLGWRAAWLAEIEPFPSAVLAHHYPDVPNLGDMTKLPERIRSGEVAAPDVFCGGTPCFTAGHMVLTASGYRDIEYLAPGDEVMTHKGRMRKILRVGSKVAKVGRLSAVGLPDGIVCTEEHPFLSSYWRNQNTKRNNVYAKVETCSEPEWVAAKDLPGRQWCALSQVEQTTCKPDSRLFDERTAMYVAGMYLGDGWLRCWEGRKKRAVMLGLNEAKYQKLLAVIGQAGHSISRERTVIKVCFGDTAFANWLDANFGRHSHLKTLPAWVMGHPHRDALLQGYMDTDGCVDGSKVTINSIGKSLAHGVCDLLNIQGWSTSIAKVETAETCVIEGRTVNQRDYFQVRANHLSISRKSRVRHGYLMRTVQAWEPAGEEMVFNIEVEEDNSFILAGAVVHNCQAFSVAGLRKSLDDARGNLSLTFCDIANEIDSARSVRGLLPSIVFWENVPGVLNTADNAFGCFLAGLAGEDEPLVAPGGKWSNAGYVLGPKRAVAWRVLDAQYFGIPQRRRRVFVVASARNGFDPAAVLFEFDGLRRDTPPRREAGQGTAHATAPCLTSSGRGVGRVGDTRGQDPVVAVSRSDVICMAHGQGGAEISCERSPTLTCNHEAPIAAYAIQAGALRTNPASGPDGVGVQADHAYTLEARAEVQVVAFQTGNLRRGAGATPSTEVFPTLKADHGRGLSDQAPCVAFHPTQDPISSTDGTTHAMGCGSSGGQASIAIAFSCKDSGGDAGAISPTLRAMGGVQPNGGGQVAVAYALQDVRDVQKAQNGRGWNDEGVSYTLDTCTAQGVAYATTQFGEVAGTLTARHDSSPCADRGMNVLAYSTKLHNTTNNQAGKFYTEYTTALDRSSPPPAVIAPVAIGAFKGGQGSAAGGIGWDAHVSPTLSSADSGSNRAPVVLTGESEVVGALACNTGPNGHDAGNFACNQAVDAGHVLPVAAMRESGQGYWMQDDIAGTLRAEGEDRPSRPSHVIGQAFQCSQSGARVGDTAATLRGSTGGGIHDHGALVATQVRRLTPVECERLQGFPDDYTNIPWTEYQRIQKQAAKSGTSFEAELKKRGKVLNNSVKECPDGPRYKALGNSWAVPVVSWIGRRIAEAL